MGVRQLSGPKIPLPGRVGKLELEKKNWGFSLFLRDLLNATRGSKGNDILDKLGH